MYHTTHSKPKSDVILLKMDYGDAWFADGSINRINFNFLMDTGTSKSVISSKCFMSIPDMFRPNLCNTRMKFQVANAEVLSSICVAHVSIQMYGYTFKLPIFVCNLGDIDCIFVHEQAEFGSMQMKMMNQNNCLGVAAMLYTIFVKFRELNLNHSRLQLSK